MTEPRSYEYIVPLYPGIVETSLGMIARLAIAPARAVAACPPLRLEPRVVRFLRHVGNRASVGNDGSDAKRQGDCTALSGSAKWREGRDGSAGVVSS